MFDADEGIAGCAYADEFIQFNLNSSTVAILRILDEKDHQKSNDGRARVNDQLPCIGKPKQWTGDGPNDDDAGCQDESGGTASGQRGLIGEIAEKFGDARWLFRRCVVTHHDLP